MTDNKKKKMTTIAISTENRKVLGELGGKEETFDDIIKKIIESYKKRH